jgi:Zn-dependent peptidase ImmA (M78 family)
MQMDNVQLNFSNAYELLEYAKTRGVEVVAPVNLSEITRILDISVEHDLNLEEKDIIGEIAFAGEKAVIRINPFQNSYKPRERFTLAHEIGHYCLHSSSSKDGFTDSRKTMSRSESYWDKFESEANSFAAQLLMPKNLLIAEGKKVINTYKIEESKAIMPAKLFIEQMCGIFEVSNKAMEYRLKNLGIVKSS